MTMELKYYRLLLILIAAPLVCSFLNFAAVISRASLTRSLQMSTSSAVMTKEMVEEAKVNIYKLAAGTNRGQLHDRMISDAYEEKKVMIRDLSDKLSGQMGAIDKAQLNGDWELVYSSTQLFRSSPFFLAIQDAYNETKKSELFFKLHELQTASWGASQIGQVTQNFEMTDDPDETSRIYSEFDTTILPLTTIPVIGFWKLFPSYGGRIVSIARDVKIDGNEVSMVLERTEVKKFPGTKVMPILGNRVIGSTFPVAKIWSLLPWNWGKDPTARMYIRYLDPDFRIMEDTGGTILVYTRPVVSGA